MLRVTLGASSLRLLLDAARLTPLILLSARTSNSFSDFIQPSGAISS
jgi:hypothetical protein